VLAQTHATRAAALERSINSCPSREPPRVRRAAFRGWPCQHRGWPRQQRVASYVSDRRVPQQESHNSSVSARAASVAQVPGHFKVCGIGSFVVHRLFWNRSCGILGFAALGLVVHRLFWNRSCGILGFAALDLLSSAAYFGTGPAAFWGLRDWVFCCPSPILESVLRHFGSCGIGSFVINRLFWNRSCGILGFAGLGLLSSIAYFGIGPAACWGLRHWVFCHPPPILESVLRHFGVCGIGSFVIHRLFWNRSCGVKRSPLSLSSRHGDMATMCVYCHIFEQQDARPATKSLPTSHKASRLGPHCDGCHSKLMSWRVSCDYSCRQAVLS
jgi:hypothetical protein